MVDIYRTSLLWITILTGIGMLFSIFGVVGGCLFHRGLVNCFIIYTILGNLTCIVLELQSSIRIIRNFDNADEDECKNDNNNEENYDDDIFCFGDRISERGLFNFSSYGARIIIVLIFVFPAIKFNQEVRKGILTNDDDIYVKREEYSCCCLPPYHEYDDDDDVIDDVDDDDRNDEGNNNENDDNNNDENFVDDEHHPQK